VFGHFLFLMGGFVNLFLGGLVVALVLFLCSFGCVWLFFIVVFCFWEFFVCLCKLCFLLGVWCMCQLFLVFLYCGILY